MKTCTASKHWESRSFLWIHFVLEPILGCGYEVIASCFKYLFFHGRFPLSTTAAVFLRDIWRRQLFHTKTAEDRSLEVFEQLKSAWPFQSSRRNRRKYLPLLQVNIFLHENFEYWHNCFFASRAQKIFIRRSMKICTVGEPDGLYMYWIICYGGDCFDRRMVSRRILYDTAINSNFLKETNFHVKLVVRCIKLVQAWYATFCACWRRLGLASGL